ncbi:MAG: hypothetical protein H5U01_17660 [Clostridia bacterium]|nr:hypothetical protein [Clostridia bacterium]
MDKKYRITIPMGAAIPKIIATQGPCLNAKELVPPTTVPEPIHVAMKVPANIIPGKLLPATVKSSEVLIYLVK